MPINRVRLGPDALRYVVSYGENEGITILLDDAACRARYAEAEFGYDVEDLRELMGAHELVAFGTHQGSWPATLVLAVDDSFTPGELESVHPEPLEGGLLRLTSSLVVCDWATYTMGCDDAGEVLGERLELEPGDYHVQIWRNFDAEDVVVRAPRDEDDEDHGEDDDDGGLYYVRLWRDPTRPVVEVPDLPGRDGWF
ncbi:MAG: hypothetical protein R3F62_19820 [Planctomycetota bacterium]